MQRFNTIRALLLVPALVLTVPAVGLVAPAQAHAGPQKSNDGALEAFKSSHEEVLGMTKSKASKSKIQGRVDKLLDYDWLATAALGGEKRFDENCGDRCGEFRELLTKVIRHNYLKLIRQGADHPVRYVEELKGKNGIYKVNTEITIKKHGREQVVKVAYVMHQADGQWVVRDIITDKVSLARTYQYEFNKLIKSKGIDAVLSSLEKKLDE